MDRNSRAVPFILFVEDDDNDAFAMELACATARPLAHVRRVSGGREAVNYLAGNGAYHDRSLYPLPTVLLLDWRMPGFSGAEVLGWVRAHPLLKHLAVVVLSGMKDVGTQQMASEMGANSFLEKPERFWELQEMLNAVVRFWSLNRVPTCIDTAPTTRSRDDPRSPADPKGSTSNGGLLEPEMAQGV